MGGFIATRSRQPAVGGSPVGARTGGGFMAPRPTTTPAPGTSAGGSTPTTQSPQQQALLQMLQRLSGGPLPGAGAPPFRQPGTYTQRYGGTMPNGSNYDSGMEAKASSGDAYSNLAADPFGKGPGGFLNVGT